MDIIEEALHKSANELTAMDVLIVHWVTKKPVVKITGGATEGDIISAAAREYEKWKNLAEDRKKTIQLLAGRAKQLEDILSEED